MTLRAQFLSDETEIYMFKKDRRREWTLKKLVRVVHKGKIRVEIADEYANSGSIFLRGYAHMPKKKRPRKIQLFLPCNAVTYRWNELIPERRF